MAPLSNDVRRQGSAKFSVSLVDVLAGAYLQRGRMLERLSPVWDCKFAATANRPAGHFCGMSRLLFFLTVSWVSLAGCGAGQEEVAFAGVAGKGGGAFELGAGFEVEA